LVEQSFGRLSGVMVGAGRVDVGVIIRSRAVVNNNESTTLPDNGWSNSVNGRGGARPLRCATGAGSATGSVRPN